MTAKPRAAKRKPDLAERIYHRLFKGRGRLAMELRIYPEPRTEIVAVIREEIERDDREAPGH